jgi:hypothetical protein
MLRGDERDLAAYYRLDEGLGLVANDASGHGHTATLVPFQSSLPIWTASGASLPIGLARSAVQLASNIELRAPTIATAAVDNLTLEAWIRWDGDPALQAIVYNGDSSRSGYGLYVQSGKPRVLVGGNGWFVCTSCQLTAGAWTHLAATRSNATWSIFLDGQLIQSSTAALVPSVPSGTFSVGGSASDHFLGALDEVRLWTTARTAAQLLQTSTLSLLGNEPSLARYFRFDEGSGVVSADASGSLQLLMNSASPSSWVTSMAPLAGITR